MGSPEAVLQRPTPPNPGRIRRAVARLQALPAFFPAVQHALRLLEDPLSTSDHLQQVINSDQALAAGILRYANSAYFGFYSQVSSTSLAITLIGRNKIAALLHRFLTQELISMLSGRKPAARQIREMSLAAATAAHGLAQRLLRSDKEEILLAGLLHDIGELVLLSQFRSDYEVMLRLADQMSRSEAEKEVFGVESRLVGKWLLEAWNFPPLFPAVVEHCPDPWAVSFPGVPLAVIVIVHAARQLAQAWVERHDPQTVADSFSARLLSTLEIDRELLADLYQQLPEQLSRLESALE